MYIKVCVLCSFNLGSFVTGFITCVFEAPVPSGTNYIDFCSLLLLYCRILELGTEKCFFFFWNEI